ncbi:MAG: transglutaminaseTgpA domain-containing protein [Bryobacteraceae bacterium]
MSRAVTVTTSVDRFFQFSLLGLVASGFFALAGSHFLDRPTLALTFAALLARALTIPGILRLEISPRLVSLAAIGYIIFYPIDFYLISRDFFTATVHGICFLAGVKILTARTNRDYLYTGAVAFIELIGAAVLSFQASFFGWLALYILFAMAAFTSAEIRRGLQRSAQTVQPPSARVGWRLALVASSATCAILIVTAGLFLVVPRTARAAAMLFPNAHRLTGYSNVVDLGVFGEISKDSRPVIHVLSYSRALPPNLKWRGTALSLFDGKRWSEPKLPGADVLSVHGTAEVAGQLQRSRRDGRRLLYRVDVNNSDTGTLFIAGIPEFINVSVAQLVRTPEDSFRVFPVTGEQLRYEVSAHSGPPLPTPLGDRERFRCLQLPPVDTRIYTLARVWAGTGSAIDRALGIQSHLRRDFEYSLETANRPLPDPLGNFLLVTKRGYCEYFASAMAVMLRTLGIPSRVVTGYQSGYYNEISGMYVIRASDAHAWVEAWIEGRGWVTFDPTPSGSTPRAGGLMARINMYFDAADSMWQQWVVAYDLGHQAELAAKFETGLRALNQTGLRAHGNWTSGFFSGVKAWAGWLLGSVLLTAIMVLAAPPLWREWRRKMHVRRIARGGGPPSDATLLYGHMLDLLEGRGFEKPVWFTPREFARHLPAAENEQVTRFTALYNAARFGGAAAGTEQLAALLQEMSRR